MTMPFREGIALRAACRRCRADGSTGDLAVTERGRGVEAIKRAEQSIPSALAWLADLHKTRGVYTARCGRSAPNFDRHAACVVVAFVAGG
jgi:hypothetical protein